ncbi:MAG: cytochrome b/b6 domain-containing protein [Hyphomicrobiaceae bacterium]|nr:cytochrome b/b6 domain-containing protein [Hyphomicrobiaceae bacterium]
MPEADKPVAAHGRQVMAWDLPTRLFHWTLVVLIPMAWVSRRYGDAGLVWHTWNGYAILVLVVWRLLWGFAGSSTSRFAAFAYWPWTAARYALDFALRRPRPFLGHNPLGGLVVFVLLGLIGLQGALGLFSYDDHDSLAGGPLSARVADEVWGAATQWHILLFDVMLAAIALHVLANILYLVWKGENLPRAMITGRKPSKPFEDEAEARIVGGGRALLCLVAAAAIVFGGVLAGGGKLL